MALSPSNMKRVLSIDGGGFRGLGCLLILDKIMEDVKRRSRRPLVPCEVFDLIGGTSTGGLITILIGRLGLDCTIAIEAYKILVQTFSGATSDSNFWENTLRGLRLDDQYDEVIKNCILTYADTSPVMVNETIDDTGAQTQCFVTTTAGAPGYNNLTYNIRSYPTPHGTVSPSPRNHQWLISEAMRATLATRAFVSPCAIPGGYDFEDAGFAGYNNPAELVRKEAKRLWPDEQIGLFVSLGAGLADFAPPDAPRNWVVTDQYTKRFADKIVSTTQSPPPRSQKIASDLVKEFVNLAIDTEATHRDMLQLIPQELSDDVYYRLDPPLGLEAIQLLDILHVDDVEIAINNWADTDIGRNYISDIATKLVGAYDDEVFLTSDNAHAITPPPPPEETRSDYNPVLDQPRPSNMSDYLRDYHVYFVIDDSSSMLGPRWTETCSSLIGIANYAFEYGSDEIELHFLNSPKQLTKIKGADVIRKIFTDVQPRGRTPTGAVLEQILKSQIDDLDQAIDTPRYREIKPLDIILITDGVPSDKSKSKEALTAAAQRMRESKHHPNCIGVQIVQVGDEKEAAVALKDLMSGDIGSMVDTVPFNGTLTSDRLERILLGGLHPNVRALLAV
ncbi:acyl transferase/acyl hydrolase/lysophospholipase, partial [Infundibulicybe gibba]